MAKAASSQPSTPSGIAMELPAAERDLGLSTRAARVAEERPTLEVEREFAQKLDQRVDIKLFVNLRGWFEIDTGVTEVGVRMILE